ARSRKLSIRRCCRVLRIPLIETGTPYEDAPLLLERWLDANTLCRVQWNADCSLLPVLLLKQLFYRAVGRHQRGLQPSLTSTQVGVRLGVGGPSVDRGLDLDNRARERHPIARVNPRRP